MRIEDDRAATPPQDERRMPKRGSEADLVEREVAEMRRIAEEEFAMSWTRWPESTSQHH